MQHFSFFSALERIEQHVKILDQFLLELPLSHPVRVQQKYQDFKKLVCLTYEAGEGWIEEDVHFILDAVKFAANKHKTQQRKDEAATSYLVHPLSVAYHLIEIGKVRDPAIIMASLLHDTLEDTATSFQELVDVFGNRVAGFVQEVTDDKSLPKEERKRLQILTASQKSAGAAQIKLADKWDNLTDLLNDPVFEWTAERIQAYFEWAKQVVEALPWVNAPLLHAVREVIHKRHSL